MVNDHLKNIDIFHNLLGRTVLLAALMFEVYVFNFADEQTDRSEYNISTLTGSLVSSDSEVRCLHLESDKIPPGPLSP